MSPTSPDLLPAIPALILAATGLLVLLAQAFAPKGQPIPARWFSLAGLLAALASVVMLARRGGGDLGGSYVVDGSRSSCTP
jgi:NADH:ubiquinone oxidoreductase subunit 2 (subunit N)